MEELQPNKYFYTRDGTVIKDVKELFEALKHMDEATFSHHVNREKNDFANWVHDVIEDKYLARALRMTTSKELITRRVFQSLFS